MLVLQFFSLATWLCNRNRRRLFSCQYGNRFTTKLLSSSIRISFGNDATWKWTILPLYHLEWQLIAGVHYCWTAKNWRWSEHRAKYLEFYAQVFINWKPQLWWFHVAVSQTTAQNSSEPRACHACSTLILSLSTNDILNFLFLLCPLPSAMLKLSLVIGWVTYEGVLTTKVAMATKTPQNN